MLGGQPGDAEAGGMSGDILETIEHALDDWSVSGDAMRWTPDASKIVSDEKERRRDAADVVYDGEYAQGYPRWRPAAERRPQTQSAPAGDLAGEMRDWLDGRRACPPAGLWFQCHPSVYHYLMIATLAPPLLPGEVEIVPQIRGVPAGIDASLPDRAWKLYSGRGSRVFREGNLSDGPTALERDYWLLDLHGAYEVAYDMTYMAHEYAQQHLAHYAVVCGHQVDAAQIRTAVSEPPSGRVCESWIVRATVSVPREPVRYPRGCGDWLCRADDHWALADPVKEPAVFAGATAEKRYVDRLWNDDGLSPCYAGDEQWRQVLSYRRGQADGNPLWTIDIRYAA